MLAWMVSGMSCRKSNDVGNKNRVFDAVGTEILREQEQFVIRSVTFFAGCFACSYHPSSDFRLLILVLELCPKEPLKCCVVRFCQRLLLPVW